MMAITQADIDKLNRAILSGHRSVQYRDRTVSYQSTQDMIEARDRFQKELDASQGKRRRRTFRAYQSGSGY
jgi:hypothetical protein